MKYIFNTLLFLLSIKASAITKVAILDTGLDINKYNNKLCPSGHKDFTGTGLNDTSSMKHGTNIHGIISSARGNFCIVIYKVFDSKADTNEATVNAIDQAIKDGVNIINYSGGGYGRDTSEARLISEFIDKGGIFIAASGNDHRDITKDKYYPAMDDDRIIVVGNTAASSNYGKRIQIVIDGNRVTGNGVTLSGSSQSTAKYTMFILDGMP